HVQLLIAIAVQMSRSPPEPARSTPRLGGSMIALPLLRLCVGLRVGAASARQLSNLIRQGSDAIQGRTRGDSSRLMDLNFDRRSSPSGSAPQCPRLVGVIRLSLRRRLRAG